MPYFTRTQSRTRPLLLFLVIIGVIAGVELVVMAVIHRLNGLTLLQTSLLDTFLLSVTMTPALYFLFFRPLRTNLQSLKQAHHKIIQQQLAIEKSQELGKAGMWEIDFRNNRISGSEQACRLMGLPPESQFDFAHFLDAVHPEDRRAVKFAWNRMLHGKPYDIEKRFLVNGQVRWFRSRVEMEFDDAGHPLKAIGFIQDVSDFKLMQEKVIRAGQLASTGQVAAMAAHEVNNPLSGITGYVEILVKRVEKGSREEDMLNRILKETERISKIVKGLLTVSYDSGNRMTYMHVTPVIVDTLQLLSAQIEKKGIDLRFALEENLPQIYCNPQQIEQVLLNIVRNAFHALQEGVLAGNEKRFIEIRTDQIEPENQPLLRLSIVNNGPNIPHDILNRITKPFFTTKSVGVGTGLGLSISKDIMDNHNGRLEILSEPGQPTEVNLYFPIDYFEEYDEPPGFAERCAGLTFEKVEVRRKDGAIRHDLNPLFGNNRNWHQENGNS